MNDTITVTVAGNITEPELRHTNGGVPWVAFRIGSSERVFNRGEGRWTDGPTSWFSVRAYRGLAEHVFESLHSGQRVIVTGKLRLRTWETSNGAGFSADIEADSVGHDLRWGTTTFQKDRREKDRGDRGDAGERRDGGDGSWSVATVGAETSSGGGRDAWAPPLSDSTAADGTLEGTAGEGPDAAGAERERVGAGADTPF